jgi:hypothetical protein
LFLAFFYSFLVQAPDAAGWFCLFFDRVYSGFDNADTGYHNIFLVGTMSLASSFFRNLHRLFFFVAGSGHEKVIDWRQQLQKSDRRFVWTIFVASAFFFFNAVINSINCPNFNFSHQGSL